MIKTIILDFDGTLGNTQMIILRSMQATIKELQLPERTDEQCAAMIGLPLTQCFTDLYPDFAETVPPLTAVCSTSLMKKELFHSSLMFPKRFRLSINGVSNSPSPQAVVT